MIDAKLTNETSFPVIQPIIWYWAECNNYKRRPIVTEEVCHHPQQERQQQQQITYRKMSESGQAAEDREQSTKRTKSENDSPDKGSVPATKKQKTEKQSDDGPTKGKGKAKRSKYPEYEEYVSLDLLAPVPLSDSEESSDEEEEGELGRAVSSIVNDPKSPEVVELSSDDMEMSPSPPPAKLSQPPPPPPPTPQVKNRHPEKPTKKR